MKTLNKLSNDGIRFVVVKRNENSYWKEDIIIKAINIEGVYLIDLTQPTHLAELAVSYPYECIKNHIQNFEAFSEDELTALENESLEPGYFNGGSTFSIEKQYTDPELSFEDAMEYERCNPTVC